MPLSIFGSCEQKGPDGPFLLPSRRAIADLSLAPLWRLLAVVLLAAPWLLPNHYEPFTSMQSDAWMGLWFVGAAAYAVGRRASIDVPLPVAVLTLCALIPGIQWAAGVLPYSGQAWLGCWYMTAAALAFLVGTNWTRHHVVEMGDVLFLAIGGAAIVSVGINLAQWLMLVDTEEIATWVMLGSPLRAVSNLNQPNQTGTFLAWGIAAMLWGRHRGAIRPSLTLLGAGWMMVGMVLTQSRTSVLEVGAITALLFLHHRHSGLSRRFAGAFALLAIGFATIFFSWSFINTWLGWDTTSMYERLHGEPRPTQWLMLLKGALLSPWTGYGWGQVVPAQLALATTPPVLDHMIFAQSHNIFLDLVLWTGFPFGLLLSGLLIAFAYRVFFRARADWAFPFQVLLMAFAVHSLLEYPFQYAYFLLPAAMAAGAVSTALPAGRTVWRTSRVPAAVLLLLVAGLGALLLRDAFRLESAWRSIRLQTANILVSEEQKRIPTLPTLSHMEDVLHGVGYEVQPKASDAELARLIHVAGVFPSGANLFNVAATMGLRGDDADCVAWLRKIMALAPQDQQLTLVNRWKALVKAHPELERITPPF